MDTETVRKRLCENKTPLPMDNGTAVHSSEAVELE